MKPQANYDLVTHPSSVITFENNQSQDDKTNDGSPTVSTSRTEFCRSNLVLQHVGQKSTDPIAFKIKTNQPQRYVVRPNQGLIAPFTSQTVVIVFVEKSKMKKKYFLPKFKNRKEEQNKFQKDKFQVQSFPVPQHILDQCMDSDSRALRTESLKAELSKVWNDSSEIRSHTLTVQHIVAPTSPTNRDEQFSHFDSPMLDDLSSIRDNSGSFDDSDAAKPEALAMRQKYNELVSFSNNLIKEKNSLERMCEEVQSELDHWKSVSLPNGKRGSKRAVLFICFMLALFFSTGIFLGFQNRGNDNPFWCHIPYLWIFFDPLETIIDEIREILPLHG